MPIQTRTILTVNFNATRGARLKINFKSIVDSLTVPTFVIDVNHVVVAWNKACEILTGIKSEDIVGTKDAWRGFYKSKRPCLCDVMVDSAFAHLSNLYPVHGESKFSKGTHAESWFSDINGKKRYLIFDAAPIYDDDGNLAGAIENLEDVTEIKLTEERLMLSESRVQHIAFHDSLTNLPNRSLLRDRLGQAVHEASRNKAKVGLLFIDLDRFKVVNDSLGHSIGDLLLQEVAKIISSAVRKVDTVARIGGDEFVVVIPKMHKIDDVRVVSNRILKKLGQTIEINEHQLHTTPSIGIAIYPENGETVDTLMKNADTAMYAVKEAGKNNFQYFTQSMNVATQNRADIEKELRVALENEQLELHYQPKIRTNPFQEVIGCEALVRWRHPECGFIMPNEFIPVAEETGLIIELGAWVTKEAIRQLATWKSQGFTGIKMAINVSPVQFRDKALIRQLKKSLKETALAPNMIEIEVTESVLMKSVPAYNEGLLALKKLGVSLAIDDFGTGYSNLSYLKEFEINTLKIDKSFVDNINSDQDDAAIVNAVISLAHSLGLEVIAEGVETVEQLEALSAKACNAYQGYYFSKPLPADQFLNYFKENQSKLKKIA